MLSSWCGLGPRIKYWPGGQLPRLLALHVLTDEVLWLYVFGGHCWQTWAPAAPEATWVPLGHICTGYLEMQRVSSDILLSLPNSAPSENSRSPACGQ